MVNNLLKDNRNSFFVVTLKSTNLEKLWECRFNREVPPLGSATPAEPRYSGVRKRVVSKRVVLADVPPERKPERGYVRQNRPFGNRPFISQ